MAQACSLGFSVPSGFFFLLYSTLIPIPAVTMLLGILDVLGYERVLRRWARQGFSDSQRLGLAAGALGFFVLFDGLLEINGSFGMSIVGLAFLVLVYILRGKVLTRDTLRSVIDRSSVCGRAKHRIASLSPQDSRMISSS